jgi:hypothetical protein
MSQVKNSNTYWLGPFGIKIPISIISVPTADGKNKRYQNGSETKMFFMEPWMTEDEYKSKFTELRTDGEWYWKT